MRTSRPSFMSAHSVQHFRWTWPLRASPAALWPLVSNTDRFNRDCGYPPVRILPPPEQAPHGLANTRRLRAHVIGIAIEWTEHAFEWIEPFRYRVERDYLSGPVKRMVVSCELEPQDTGGTLLHYDVQIEPANVLGRLAVPFSIGRRARDVTERVFRHYDALARQGRHASDLAQRPRLAPGGAERLENIVHSLTRDAPHSATLVQRLAEHVRTADDLSAARLRPYALADSWHVERRATLELCLHATRAGLLDFRWELICPHCRGAKAAQPTLAALKPDAHCDTCNLDFTANFDQSVELTFAPNPAVRPVARHDYCVGGPQVTPHVVAQQRLRPGETRVLRLALAPGRYRVRVSGIAEQHAFHVAPDGETATRIDLAAKPLLEPVLRPDGELVLVHAADRPGLALVERLAWSDQSSTAAEATSLQLFRDLFSREVLRRGEQISVGALTIVFTDLKNSTQLYQQIGDAPAFGRVLTHFEILKTAVAAEGGTIVKTMGDAVMAVFTRPVAAVRAMSHAQQWLAAPDRFASPGGIAAPASTLPPLALKAGLHSGPCLAINQNDRLDYFGSTVNFAARLCGLASGADLILSSAAHADPEVVRWLASPDCDLVASAERAALRGFGDAPFTVFRWSRR